MTGTKTYIFIKTTCILTNSNKYVSLPRGVMKSLSPEESFELILVKTSFNGNCLEFKNNHTIKIKQLSLSVCLAEIYSYFVNFINKMRETKVTHKIQLTLKLTFTSSKNDKEKKVDQFYQKEHLGHLLNQQKN